MSCTNCGLPAALFIICRVAASLPALADGWNVTVIEQFAFAATLWPSQALLTAEKSAWFGPVIVALGLGRTSGAFPVLVTTTVCDGLVEPDTVEANVRLVGLTLATGAVGMGFAVPLRGICCGLLAALSATCRVADSAPDAVRLGAYTTCTVQVAPGARFPVGQLFVCLKSLLFCPLIEMAPSARFTLPLFVRTRDRELDDVPAFWMGKVSEVGANAMEGKELTVITDAVELDAASVVSPA